MTPSSDADEETEAARGTGGQPSPVAVTNPEGFRTSPIGHVYGIVDDPERDVPAVVGELLAAHLPLDGIHVYCCSDRHGGHDLVHYGRLTWERLSPTSQQQRPAEL